MHIRKVFLIIAACLVFLLLAGNIFQAIFWPTKAKKMEQNYNDQISELEERLAAIGPTIDTWTVNKLVLPGQKIAAEDLKPVKSYKSTIGDSYITNTKEIIGKVYKVGIIPGTPLTKDVIMEEKLKNSSRQFDVVSTMIPIGLKAGDYIDFRFLMARGEDYIGISHKRVEAVLGKVVTLQLSEEEIHIYQSMLVDCFLKEGSQLYMTKYLEPGIQEPAKTYYPVSENVLNIVLLDPNLQDKLETAVLKGNRDLVNSSGDSLSEKVLSLIKAGRSTTQANIDTANAAFWDQVQKALQEIEKNGGVTKTTPNGNPSVTPNNNTTQPASSSNGTSQSQSQTQQQSTKQPDKPAAGDSVAFPNNQQNNSTAPQSNNQKLKIQEGVVE